MQKEFDIAKESQVSILSQSKVTYCYLANCTPRTTKSNESLGKVFEEQSIARTVDLVSYQRATQKKGRCHAER
jgi:hypothetical protein